MIANLNIFYLNFPLYFLRCSIKLYAYINIIIR